MKNLLLSSLFLITLVGCSFYYGFKKVNIEDTDEKAMFSIFNDDFEKALFKTKINFRKHYFSGLLFIKSPRPDIYRITFINEIGLKFFDFEYLPSLKEPEDSIFKVHYCMEQFNKEALLNIIEQDLRLIFMKEIDMKEAKFLKNDKDSMKVFKITTKNGHNSYFFNQTTNHPIQIKSSTGLFKKTNVELTNYKDNFPWNINITHRYIKLKIQFILLENK